MELPILAVGKNIRFTMNRPLPTYCAVWSPWYKSVALYYYIQYHLHVQLSEVKEYAHRAGVVLKGDIPIGISRTSVDAWVNPQLFHMDSQAGAPPTISR